MNARSRMSMVSGFLCAAHLLLPLVAVAQTSTYHLHNESGSNFATLALNTAPPHPATVIKQSGDMKGRTQPLLNQSLGLWTTPIGEPQRTGAIPAGSVVTFTLWMRKTSTFGVVYPFASAMTVETLDVNFQGKAFLCSTNGATPLDTTLRAYTFTCSTGSVPMASVDRFAVFAGYSMTQAPGNKSMRVELHIEGSTNSRAALPLPPPAPSITSLTPTAAAVGESVVVAGANFGATQGSSTVRFNGTLATATSWSSTSITATVPAGAASGPVVVTVNGAASNSASFTVVTPPTITALNPASGVVNQAVTISGAGFEATQGSSTVTFNGVAAPVASWSASSLTAAVPPGATSGPVVVTVNGRASNGMAFTVIPPPSIASIDPPSAYPGAAVTVHGTNLGPGTPAVTFNGVSASVTTATSTAITAIVPALATSGPVVVTVDGQTSNAIPFEVLATNQNATLTIQTFTFDESAPGGQGPPAGAGVSIKVDGVAVGQTAVDGTLTVDVLSGDRLVTGSLPPSTWGEAAITLAPGETRSVAIVLSDSKDASEPTGLSVVEAVDGIVPMSSPSFTMEFVRDGARVPMASLVHVDVLDRGGNLFANVTSQFVVSNGAIVTPDPFRFFGWVPWDEPAVLRVGAIDAAGVAHSNVVRFSVGQLGLTLTLAAPPSNPALAVSNIQVSISVLGSDSTLVRTSDAQGRIVIPALPYGTVLVDAETEAAAIYYAVNDTVTLTGDTSATLVLRSAGDLLSGVPPLAGQTSSQNTPAALLETTSTPPARARLEAERRAWELERLDTAPGAGPPRAGSTGRRSVFAAAQEPVSISVTSFGADEAVEQSAALTVPQGTRKVTLKFNVTSLEYPRWVREKSPYDDVWILRVTVNGPGGRDLFRRTRNVNSQLNQQDPYWQADSTTGEIQAQLDVQALAANGDVQLVLFASSKNVRDHLFPTTVNAELGAPPELVITKIDKDLVPTTKGDSTYYSIPRNQGKTTNTRQRWFTLHMSRPENTTITKVRLRLLDQAGAQLQELVNAAPGASVKLINNGDRIEVRGTFDTASQIVSTPPSTHYLRYEFVVEGTVDGEQKESDPKSAPEMHALWRMPDGFGRYSEQEPDGDDWATRGTYDWLERNRSLITRINDISGEHARNIGHSEHERGVDIDMFHFYTFPNGAASGGTNYARLCENVVAALNGGATEKGRVTDWVSGTRTGMGALADMADVERIIYAKGSEFTAGQVTLPAGWAETLIKTGTLTVGTKTLDTGAGAWSKASNSKLNFWADHNDHVHIDLDDARLLK